jgi:hypothetical protein
MSATAVEFRVLGALEARASDGNVVSLGAVERWPAILPPASAACHQGNSVERILPATVPAHARARPACYPLSPLHRSPFWPRSIRYPAPRRSRRHGQWRAYLMDDGMADVWCPDCVRGVGV